MGDRAESPIGVIEDTPGLALCINPFAPDAIVAGDPEGTVSDCGFLVDWNTLFSESPARPTPELFEVWLDVSVVWFFRNALEPRPRSSVCLNHVGSLESNDCRI